MVRIAFTGDIAFSKYFKGTYDDPDLIATSLIDFLQDSDYVVPNVEGALTAWNTKRGDASIPAHASDPRSVKVLDRINGNIWNLSNNHTLDCGVEGLLDTLHLAKEHHALTLGAGMNEKDASKSVIIKEEGGIGFLSVCYKKMFKASEDRPGLIDWNDFALIQKTIKRIKKENRFCILIVHGGEEFSDLPVPYVRNKYRRYLRMGADIVVGHHPHVPQGYETVGKKIIFYSLGNFIFDTDYQRLQPHTDLGILLKLQIKQGSVSWAHMPYRIDRKTQRILPLEVTPVVFSPITPRLYRRVAPFAVDCFLKKYKRAKIFLKPYFRAYSSMDWAKWYIKEKGFWNSLSLLTYRVVLSFGTWKKVNPELIQYLREQVL